MHGVILGRMSWIYDNGLCLIDTRTPYSTQKDVSCQIALVHPRAHEKVLPSGGWGSLRLLKEAISLW